MDFKGCPPLQKKAKPSPEQVTQHKDLPPRNRVGTTYVQTLAFGLARAVDLGFHLKSQWGVAGQCQQRWAVKLFTVGGIVWDSSFTW